MEVPLLPSADLSVRKENTGGSAVPGTPFLYTITLQNAGPSDAQDVLLTDAVPAELWTPEFSTDNGATWTPWHSPYLLGTLAAGASLLPPAAGDHRPRRYPSPSQYRCGGQFHPGPGSHQQHRPAGGPPSARCGPGHHQGGRYRHCCPWRPADLYAHHRQPGPCHRPGCSSHRPDSRRSVPRGSFPGQRAHLDPVDRGLFPGSASSRSGKNPAAARQPVFLCPGHPCKHRCGGQLHPGPKPQQQHRHQPGPCPGKHRASSDQNLPCWAVPCQYLVYRLVAVNWGSIPAEGVVVQDHLPPPLSAGVYSLDGGITWRPWQGLLSFGTLAPGATATLLVAGVVHPCAQGTITNTAVISSQTAGQSTAAVTTPVWPPQGYRPVWHGTGC